MENQIKFHGRGGEFFGIWIVNLLLSIVTLGVYSAWAKVRTKKYFYGNTEFGGDRFDYHGAPIQILKGRIIAMACVLVWFISSSIFPLVSALLFLIFSALTPWLIRNNTRFDARVTSYRNVRFDFTGTVKSAYSVFLLWPFLCYLLLACCFVFASSVGYTSLTAGMIGGLMTAVLGFILFSWVSAQIATYFINGYRYGSYLFSAELSTKQYMVTYLLGGLLGMTLAIVLLIVAVFVGGSSYYELINLSQISVVDGGVDFVLVMLTGYGGMILIALVVNGFIKARIRNYLFGQIKINDETDYSFASAMTTVGLVSLMVTNFAILVVTLGFAHPWVKVRSSRYVASVTTVKGDLNTLMVDGDEFDTSSAVADEVAEAFDLNIGIG
ncbi:YjgN family protein [Photobacterium sanguinicancri]|uniref:YjgN family protein n=1 Tax=Photobacterium sanguinicancri TaxID=875932 RepID=UPI0021C4AEBF|nr:YjgN family protein [Photobacterium sanguinicancri]